MKLALVSMPWSSIHRPSAPLGALASYIREHEPSYAIECIYDYMHVATAIGLELYDHISNVAYDVGEVIYCAILYPERRRDVIALAEQSLSKSIPEAPETPLLPSGESTWRTVIDAVCTALDRQIDRLVRETANRFDAVGLTTCFGQLFANLAYAKRLKEVSPKTQVILGGSTISGRVGPTILTTYPFVDRVVQGEGEAPLLFLLRSLESDNHELPERGVLARENCDRFPSGVPLWEVPNLDALPVPAYDEYVELATQRGIEWLLPIEGSRGCWWDRVKTAANPRSTCYFCNLNVQWNGYREKSVARVASELDELSKRYANNNIFFLDNIVRHKDVGALAAAIKHLGQEFSIFYEMRASIRPPEILALWEAGLDSVQFGIEALSTSVLRRIGKGTSLLQNLEAMKTCYELGIRNMANLLVGFPGSTAHDVRETCENIRSYAICYEPLQISTFHLGVGSTIDTLRDDYGVVNVRNNDRYFVGLPESIARTVQLLDLSYDLAEERTDWSAAIEACDDWRATHVRLGTENIGRLGPRKALLTYRDGGSYLVIEDSRWSKARYVLKGVSREIYIYAMQIRSFESIAERFTRGPNGADLEELRDVLAYLLEEKLMVNEGTKYLSLAVAPSPQAAARRIREAARDDANGALPRAIQRPTPRRLPLSTA